MDLGFLEANGRRVGQQTNAAQPIDVNSHRVESQEQLPRWDPLFDFWSAPSRILVLPFLGLRLDERQPKLRTTQPDAIEEWIEEEEGYSTLEVGPCTRSC